MEIIRGHQNLCERHRGCVATIGNFDGVHLGHQVVLSQVANQARRLGLPAVVILFEPQPMEYFAPDRAPSRLMHFRDKIHALETQPVDRVLCLRFGPYLSGLTAEEFVRIILVEGLGVRHLVVGDDFRFGKGRGGDFALLERSGAAFGFEVSNTHSFFLDDARVSSTRIRNALEEGDLGTAKRLLGRDFSVSGRVAHGNKLGRTIGFPTANILLKRKVSPVRGVFAVRTHGVVDGPVNGVANVGTRPTVDGGTRMLLEVHLFDFSATIYGAHVFVDFLHRLRDERRFESFDALKEQIQRDAQAAQAGFSTGAY
ncbi:MAG: bifunctional riboflavin kinase/FAD synthetase [Chromatiales bacterium]|nr:bifunctional riboflavin kinase/FAD synthetase [Chromatiales bacterium]